jgi:hypothetical protein
MSDPTGRSPRWTPGTGDYSERQLHAMEFIASSLDRIDGHLETIAASIGGSGPHRPFGDVLSDSCAPWAMQLRVGAANPAATVNHDCRLGDLPATIRISHALTMFVVTEAKAAMIRTAYEQRGEFSAAVLIGVIVVILVILGFLGLR